MIDNWLICPEVVYFHVIDGRLPRGVLPFGCTAKLPSIFIFEPPHFQEGISRIFRLLGMLSVCPWIFRAITLFFEMGSLHLALAILVILFDLFLEIGLRFVLIQGEMAVIFCLGFMCDRVWVRTSLRLRLLERWFQIGYHLLILILWCLTLHLLSLVILIVPVAAFHITLLIKYHLIPHHKLDLQIFLVQFSIVEEVIRKYALPVSKFELVVAGPDSLVLLLNGVVVQPGISHKALLILLVHGILFLVYFLAPYRIFRQIELIVISLKDGMIVHVSVGIMPLHRFFRALLELTHLFKLLFELSVVDIIRIGQVIVNAHICCFYFFCKIDFRIIL